LVAVRARATESWLRGVYRRVNRRMRLLNEEFEEEMGCLRNTVEELNSLRKRLLIEKYD